MANGLTETRSIRRGLPRTPGGEPWPPAGDVAAVALDSAAQPAEQPAAQQPTAAQPVALRPTEHAPAAPQVRSVRQGLPRVAGASAAPVAATPTVESPTAPAVAAQPVAVIERQTAGATESVPVRRGLPRSPDSEPWPPYDEVVTRVAEPLAPAVAQVPAPTAEQVAVAVEAAPAPLATPPTSAPARTSAPAPARTSAPAPSLLAPREPDRFWRFTARQWAGIAGVGVLVILALGAVIATQWLRTTDWMQDFLTTYPGESHLPEGAPVGIPAWLGWQHFFNVFLIVLIIRSGLQVRTQKRPPLYWSPRWNPSRKISINLWFHQSLDILWLVNGVIYVVLLFTTGQWVRVVPTSWDIVPNALSALVQYVSLTWPTENGWVNYNSLQVLAYFTTIFIAAPLAVLTGVRMSGIWPTQAKTLSRLYPLEWARALHFPVMLYFVAFIVVHVGLVLSTGILRNLNHMFASQDVVNWLGFGIFVVSMLVIAGAWIAARPIILAAIARAFGRVSGR